MSKLVFLFDIDGTLLLTGGAGLAAINRVFEDLSTEKEVWQNLVPDGRTDAWIIEQLFASRFKRPSTRNEMKQISSLYVRYLDEELSRAQRFRLMPRAKASLQILADRIDVSLGLATGNFEKAAYSKLKAAGLDNFFQYGGFGSDAVDRLALTQIALRRAIDHLGSDPLQTFVVGDTIHDIRCGRQIGAKTIAVCTGYTPRRDLEEAGANWVLDDLGELDWMNFEAGS